MAITGVPLLKVAGLRTPIFSVLYLVSGTLPSHSRQFRFDILLEGAYCGSTELRRRPYKIVAFTGPNCHLGRPLVKAFVICLRFMVNLAFSLRNLP